MRHWMPSVRSHLVRLNAVAWAMWLPLAGGEV